MYTAQVHFNATFIPSNSRLDTGISIFCEHHVGMNP